MRKCAYPIQVKPEELADWAYIQHHFACPKCIAAGRGDQYGPRCDIGAPLWLAYQANTRSTEPLTPAEATP